jgi:hypothetical protein
LIVSVLYIACITAAIVANQRGIDAEGVIVGQVLLGLPWDLPMFIIITRIADRSNGWYFYAAAITLNAATVYLIVAWLSTTLKT